MSVGHIDAETDEQNIVIQKRESVEMRDDFVPLARSMSSTVDIADIEV